MDAAALLDLEHQLRQAGSLREVSHAIVNQTHRVLPYMQAVLLEEVGAKRLRPIAASDIPTIDFTAPFFAWIERMASDLAKRYGREKSVVTLSDVSAELRDDWQELAPGQLLWMPLHCAAGGNNRPCGVMLLFRAEPWKAADLELADHLSCSFGYAVFAQQRCHLGRQTWQSLTQPRLFWLAAGLAAAAMWLPVNLTALAPVEVVARDPRVVTAPIDGAVREVLVIPNQPVREGMPLVRLEDTELSAAYDVAKQALLVAEAELRTAQQGGFVDANQKSRLSQLESAVRLREAEATQAALRLAKTRIDASATGVVVLDDPDAWKGRPVRVGERIMLLADETRVELEIMLAVKDSIAIRNDAPVTLFFDNDPLTPKHGKVKRAGYEPVSTADAQLAYRLVARLDASGNSLPRIGLRGTAKIHGERVTLFFYLFRRPITWVRQSFGW